MDEAVFLNIFQKFLVLILQMSAPVLLITIIVGLIISIIQSVTQIQEQTLTFVPKIFAGIIILIITMPWMITTFVSVVNEMFEYIPAFIGS
ncbi:flagellar biosynthesis protein FliQ [bacterium]|nr:flagellar biosynthesis protein FliQ [bacterium]